MKAISITKPCHETWQAMTPVSGGRHCQSCCKIVTDFTLMSNDEIIAYLSSHTDVCGRIGHIQIAALNQSLTKPVKRMPAFLNFRIAALFAGIMAFSRIEARGNPHGPAKVEQIYRQLRQDSIAKDTSGYITVTGTVCDNDDGTPIPGVTIV